MAGVHCKQCGIEFPLRKWKPKYCSTSCKQKAGRQTPAGIARTKRAHIKQRVEHLSTERLEKIRRKDRERRKGVYRPWESRLKEYVNRAAAKGLEFWPQSFRIAEHAIEAERKRAMRAARPKVVRKRAIPPAEYWRHRYRTNPGFNVYERLRRQFRKWLRGERRSVPGLLRDCGYTREELVTHLERQFLNGMGWDNYGAWHIDHIKPKILFDPNNQQDVRACWALTNLRPLWAGENCGRAKDGSDTLL